MRYWKRLFVVFPLMLMIFITGGCSGLSFDPVAIRPVSPWDYDEAEMRDKYARSRDEIEIYYEGEMPPFLYRIIGSIRSEVNLSDSDDIYRHEEILKERMVDKAWRQKADAIIEFRYEHSQKNEQEILKALGRIVRKR